MNSNPLNNEFFLETSSVTQFVKKIFDESAKCSAQRVELCYVEDTSLQITFIVDDTKKEHNFNCAPAFWKSILQACKRREYFTFNDSKQKTISSKQTTNWISCSTENFRKLSSKETSLAFVNLQYSDVNPINSDIHTTSYNKNSLAEFYKAKKGIIIADCDSRQAKYADSFRYLTSYHPGVRICQSPRTISDIRKIVELAKDQLVVLGRDCDDVIESIFEVAHISKDDIALTKEFFQKVIGSYVRKEIRKTCNACAKITAVSSNFLKNLPEALHPPQEFEYMFGRGCSKCDQSTYSGTLSIESTYCMSAEIRKHLVSGASAAEITELATREGARSLLEDGIDKILNNLTSFEEVLSAVKKISSGFLGAAVHRSNNNDLEHPSETKLRESLEDIKEGFFKEQNEKPELLIVEDDDDQREVLKAVLEHEGYSVRTAKDGEEGMKRLQESTTDIIVCDLMMPVMNGEEFVKSLRKDNSLSQLPVLMLTAIEDEDKEYNLLVAGADDYCTKGTKKKLILKRIEKLLHKTRNPVLENRT